ncbi:MAG TPA: glutaredoxin domain-containing protein [Glaciihabitans sp.]|nr:glutaredoxin domain-containing protein [Glaciihabitans sp.]
MTVFLSGVTSESMVSDSLKLYVKVWCPWCVMAREWLDGHGFTYDLIDVEKSRASMDEMVRLSAQRYTPTLVTGTGAVLPDFGPDELEPFLKKHSIAP